MSDQPLPCANRERFVAFECSGQACLGVLSVPPPGGSVSSLGVVIVVGGPQYRVGSHRQFVLTARALAAAGFPTLRFDYRGMGDSEGDFRVFDTVDVDIGNAVAALRRESGVMNVVLWGLCDGASASLMYGSSDPCVAGIVAVNPWARSVATEASTLLRHYYLGRILSRKFWADLVRGGVSIGLSLAEFGRTIAASRPMNAAKPPGFLVRMHASWLKLRRPVLFLLSGRDYTAREFETWVGRDPKRRELLESARSTVIRIPEADHTFSSHALRDRVAKETIAWLGRIPHAG